MESIPVGAVNRSFGFHDDHRSLSKVTLWGDRSRRRAQAGRCVRSRCLRWPLSLCQPQGRQLDGKQQPVYSLQEICGERGSDSQGHLAMRFDLESGTLLFSPFFSPLPAFFLPVSPFLLFPMRSGSDGFCHDLGETLKDRWVLPDPGPST